MVTAWAGRAGADGELAGKLGLTGCCQRRAFLMTDADPFDLATADGIGERIEGIADQSE
jgi:hypothetical protein